MNDAITKSLAQFMENASPEAKALLASIAVPGVRYVVEDVQNGYDGAAGYHSMVEAEWPYHEMLEAYPDLAKTVWGKSDELLAIEARLNSLPPERYRIR